MLSRDRIIGEKRRIDDILQSREDLSPALIHLTKDYKGRSAEENLRNIIDERMLRFGEAAS
jgi:hypothetical protein